MKQKKSRNLFFILCFIPFLQWIPFFIMNGKLPKKRWLMMGFVNIAILVVAISLPFLGDAYRENNRMPMPGGAPEETDYAGERPYLNDYFEEDYWDIENYEKTPEYKQYDKDLDAWYKSEGYREYEKALQEWNDTPEYKEYEEHNNALYVVSRSCETAQNVISLGCWLIFMILGFFVERYKFIRELEINQNRSAVYGQLSSRVDIGKQDEPNVPLESSIDRHSEIPVESRIDMMNVGSQKQTTVVNVNLATEEELMGLPGMKTIDAKKIISYRQSNGSFRNEDEFFAVFDAKPHIIVKMQSQIAFDNATGMANANNSQNVSVETKRRFDL